MPRKKKDCYERIKDQIDYIRQIPSYITPSPHDSSYHPHTLLKLAYLNYYIGIFLPIAKSYIRNGKIFFVDAFGGSGLVKIKGLNLHVKGSSLLAALANMDKRHRGYFHKVYSFEIDKTKYKLLKERFEEIQKRYSDVELVAILGDVNEKISEIVDEVNSNDYGILFIDPEGMEPDMLKFMQLIDKSQYIDIIMNFTEGIKRVVGAVKNGTAPSNLIDTVKRFLPTYEQDKDIDKAVEEMFNQKFGKPRGKEVKIKSKGHKVEYLMMIRVRKTPSNARFLEGLNKMVECIERFDGELIKVVLNQEPLNSFLNNTKQSWW